MSSIVIEQGTILDRIDFNLTETLQSTKKGNIELIKVFSEFFQYYFNLINLGR